jgi:hypothetical protein
MLLRRRVYRRELRMCSEQIENVATPGDTALVASGSELKPTSQKCAPTAQRGPQGGERSYEPRLAVTKILQSAPTSGFVCNARLRAKARNSPASFP